MGFDKYQYSISQDNKKYPVILTPSRIIKAIDKDLTKNEVYKLINVFPEKSQVLYPPAKPVNFQYIERRRLNNGCGIFWGIIILIFPVGMLIYSLYRGGIEVSLLFLALTILSIIFFINQETSIKHVKEKVPDTLHHKKIEEYEKKVIDINKQNELNDIEFKKKYEEINQKHIHKIGEYKTRLYYNELIPISIAERNFDNIQRGKREIEFLSYLVKAFGNQIKVDISPKLPYKSYFPDFVFVCNKTSLHIDIEIDEPYSIKDKTPIHYIDSSDYERNNFFLNQNWCVIRFSESQVFNQPDECINLISNYVDSIIKKQKLFKCNLNQENRWTYEEALVMANENYRKKYLIKRS